jgi:hypothetical protein
MARRDRTLQRHRRGRRIPWRSKAHAFAEIKTYPHLPKGDFPSSERKFPERHKTLTNKLERAIFSLRKAFHDQISAARCSFVRNDA